MTDPQGDQNPPTAIARRPILHYPAELPISERRDDIVRAIRDHQVIILSGETGSGKTTQLPKMCLDAGRGRTGLIGCTQPRRIAALTVADRIAEELGEGIFVGCRIRFSDSSRPGNLIRVLTDGMLLAEAQGNPNLRAYDTIIIDEAHERSLNIDVLLGMLKRLLRRRPDLKAIITSATLDTAKFSRHFDDAPVIEVTGRTYPVEIRYRPPSEDEAAVSLPERTALILEELILESPRGDLLAFLPTEQDIRETIDLVGRRYADRLDIVPLYARLPASDQKLAFRTGGKRKLVVATNVAETSLTIPGIRYVVDSGLARISRYNPGTGTHGLPIDPISRAAADQRSGRCGRVGSGVCIRMYSAEDYEVRPEYTPPEIRRTNLAEVILRLLDLGISDIESFPFVDPPEAAGVRDGMHTLEEIGAVSRHGRGKKRQLTADGRLMARLPLDPRLARVLIQADREACLGDVLPIVSALSLVDPRERPADRLAAADAAHLAFQDEDSDFIGWLNIWDAFRTDGAKGSYSSRLKKFCSAYYLSFRRMREWMDVHRQLTLVMEEHGYRPHRRPTEPSRDPKGRFSQRYAAIHRSLISGFLSHIARHELKGEYQATRNRRLRVHPSSSLHRRDSAWIVAAEIVRTSRLYGRTAAGIDPDWLIDLGRHLLVRSWVLPHWSRKSGMVMATEQVRLFGFLLPGEKTIPYGGVRPAEARTIFIRSALVGYDVPDPAAWGFLTENRALMERLGSLEEKLRRRDLLAGETAVEEFYSRILPPDVLDTGTLNRYIRESGEEALVMSESDLLTGDVPRDILEQYPDHVRIADTEWEIKYHFDPESELDGATLKIPAGRTSELAPGMADWVVPGLLPERIEALMRGLDKPLRKQLIPIRETAMEAAESISKEQGSLIHTLSRWLFIRRGIDIPFDAWKPESLPNHLRIRLSVVDERGRELASGRDSVAALPDLEHKIQQGGSGRIAAYRKAREIEKLITWPECDLPESVTFDGTVVLWPALVDDGDSVSFRYLAERTAAEVAQKGGQARLARIYWSRELRDFSRSIHLGSDVRRFAAHLGGTGHLEEQVWNRVVLDVFGTRIVRTASEWTDLLLRGGGELSGRAELYMERVSRVVMTVGEVRKELNALLHSSHRPDYVRDRLGDVERVAGSDFVTVRDVADWEAMPRWLRGILIRTRRGLNDPAKEIKALETWNRLRERLDRTRSRVSPFASVRKTESVRQACRDLEELGLVLFTGGEIRSIGRISESRFLRLLDEIDLMP